MLLATLVLVARLLAPAFPSGHAIDPAAAIGPLVICHGGDGPAPSPDPGPSETHDCLLCPACHLVGAAILPTPATGFVRLSTPVVPARPERAAPATGPPHPARLAARPTGPPFTSA